MTDGQSSKTTELLLASCLAAFGLVCNAPFTAALAAGLGVNWVSDLPGRLFQHWDSTRFTPDDQLNHDIVIAMVEAFRKALQQLERDWPRHADYQQLSWQLQRITGNTLQKLRRDTNHIFASERFPTDALQRQEIVSILKQSTDKHHKKRQMEQLMLQTVRDYLAGRTPALIHFVEANLFANWQTRFREELKNPDARGTRTWRAYHLMFQEQVREEHEEIKEELKKGFAELSALLAEHTTDPATRAAARKELLTTAHALFASLPTDTLPDAAPLPTGSRMPYIRNPLFVGRADDLQALAAALKGGTTVVVNQQPSGQTAAATGLGGIGKTQLAAEFAHRYGHFFAGGVFWLSFTEAGAVPSEVATCGDSEHMNLHPHFSDLKLADQVKLVRAAWKEHLPRLLIFDNCEDEALLTEWRPKSGGCHVLITSRRATWERTLGVHVLPLGVLAREESIALLQRHIRSTAPLHEALDAIAAELGDLPLALHLAGSYLARYRSVTPEQYLEQVRQPALLQHRSMQGAWLNHSPTSHEHHVGRTFALSYKQLDPNDAIDSRAIALLARAACFAPGEPVPRDLLIATVTGADESDEATLDAEDGVHRLLELGLLEEQHPDPRSPTPDPQPPTPALQLHRLLAAFVQESAHDETAQTAVQRVMISTSYELNEKGIPAPLLVLQTHLRHITETALEREDEQAVTLATNLGYHLDMIGDYRGAKPYYEWALAIREQILDPQDTLIALSLNNLALLLQTQGDYEAARPLLERALAIREQTLGSLHPDTATSLNNLALLLQAQGDYAAARPLYQRALAIREQTLGAHHPDTANSLNNLAALLHTTGKSDEALPLLKRALDIWECVLGKEHPHITSAMLWIATIYQAQGDYAAARPLYQRALAIDEQVYGPHHPEVATDLNNLAGLHHAQGNYEAARPLYDRALAIREQTLGDSHPDTATSLNNLAGLLKTQGDYEAARPLYQRALAIREQVLGENHPHTANSLNNLAGLLQTQGDYAAARPLHQRALAIREQTLGENHPHTATSLNNLAALHYAQGDYEAARPLYQRALAIREQVLGAHHPDTANSLNNLAGLHRAQGDYAAARPLYDRALAIREQVLGAHHPDTANSLNNLAGLHHAQGNYEAARPLYERALAIDEQVYGPDHPEVATDLNNLAVLCYYEEQYSEAAELMRRALSIREAVLGENHPHTQSSRQSLEIIEAQLGRGSEG